MLYCVEGSPRYGKYIAMTGDYNYALQLEPVDSETEAYPYFFYICSTTARIIFQSVRDSAHVREYVIRGRNG